MEENLNSQLEELINSKYIEFKENLLNDLSEKKLEKGRESFKKNKEEKSSIHKNIICTNCFKKNFSGKRYICCECDNFNLCGDCEELHTKNLIEHNLNHIFIKINKPINIDINKYDTVIKGKNQNLTIKNNQAIANITIFNTGEESLKDCFLSPIVFGGRTLYGPKIKIKEDVKKNHKIDTTIIIDANLENLNKEQTIGDTKEYITCWRMFTKEGIPFGDIISLYISGLSTK